MRNGYSVLKVLSTIGLIVTFGVGVSACGGSESWKEQVQFSDGRVIVVDRELILEAGGDEWASNRSGSKPKEYRIRFADPDGSGKVIDWRSTRMDIQTWPEIPLILDVESAQLVVYSTGFNPGGCYIYFKYYYRNGAWIEEKLPEQFPQRMTNLLFGDHTDMPAFVSQDEKRVRNDYTGVRKALMQAGPNLKVCG